jgi:SAM-dependent methyltransferase
VKRYDEWFARMWDFVEPALPPAGAAVIEIGCGKLGGFVPRLRAAGYDAIGVDPNAPEEPGYQRVEFERYQPPDPAGAIIACTSLHHVSDLDIALDHVAATLAPGAPLIVIEMGWERFDEATARWCFDHLAPVTDPESDEASWLHHHRAEFIASGLAWEDYQRAWATGEGLHQGARIVRGLDARFARVSCQDGPYFFAELDGVTFADEQAAIDAGQITAVGIRYLATRRSW